MNHQAKIDYDIEDEALAFVPDTRTFPDDFGSVYKGEIAAYKFVELLTGWCEMPVHWRLLQNDKGTETPYEGKVNHFGMLPNLYTTFQAAQKNGASPFMVINGGGQKAEDINEIRACYIDVDDTHNLSEIEFHTRPDFIVKRDETHFHAYWLCSDLTNNQFKDAQERLIAHYGSDITIKDLSRVMRVPGFLHLKDLKNPCSPVLYDLRPSFGPDEEGMEIQLLPRKYAHIVSGLPTVHEQPDAMPGAQSGSPVSEAMLRDMLSYIHPDMNGDQNTWLGVAKCVRWDAPICKEDRVTPDEDVDRDQLLVDWCSGSLMLERTKSDPKVTLYQDREELLKRVDPPRKSGSKIGLGTIIKLAMENGYKGITPLLNHTNVDKRILSEIEVLNERFAMLTYGPNAGRIFGLSNKGDPFFLEESKFKSALRSQKVLVVEGENSKQKNVADIWLNSPDQAQYEGIGFAPPGSIKPLPNAYFNLWQKFAVEPKSGGDHNFLLDHIRKIVCGGNEEYYDWFLDWLADSVQRPGIKCKVAVALYSEGEGTGKGIVGEYMRAIFGQHGALIDDAREIVKDFNFRLANKVFLTVEDAVFPNTEEKLAQLRNSISEKKLTFEPKFAHSVELENYWRILATTNKLSALPISIDDRRWTVFEVNEDFKNDKNYFAPIWDALENGEGAANLLYFLINHQYNADILKKPIMTEVKAQLVGETKVAELNSVQEWLREVLNGEYMTNAFDENGSGIEHLKSDYYQCFEAFCDKHKDKKKYTESKFWPKLFDTFGGKDSVCQERRATNKNDEFPTKNERPLTVRICSRNKAKEAMAKKIKCSPDLLFSDDE